jgi:hypothetical protein
MQDSVHVGAVVMNAKPPLDEAGDFGAAPRTAQHPGRWRAVHENRAQSSQVAWREPPWAASGRLRRKACLAVRARYGPPAAHAARIDLRATGHLSRRDSLREQTHREQPSPL